MKKLLTTLGLFACGSLLPAAPDEAALRSAMKQIGPTCSGLGKKIAAKDATSAADAKKLHALFDGVQTFWKEMHADDAVGFAKEAGAAFQTIARQTAAGEWEEAGASFKKATANCAGCHSAHREKAADGSWKVK